MNKDGTLKNCLKSKTMRLMTSVAVKHSFRHFDKPEPIFQVQNLCWQRKFTLEADRQGNVVSK